MRRGASMPELLVAMLVLLVGIWVVAAKFPKLAELMTEERTRDKMTRKAEQAMEDAKQALPSLPSLVAAYGATSAGNPEGTDESVSPYYDPAQPLNWFDNTRPVNCVENTLNVFGETFRVPGPPPQTPIPAVWQAPYFLRLGPAAADVQGSGTNETIVRPRVYQPIPLTRDDTIAPTARVAPATGAFCLRDDGVFRLCLPERDPQGNPFTPRVPSNSAQIEVSYTWVDKDTSGNQRQHQTCGELLTCTPDAGGVVTWTSPAVSAIAVGGEVVPNSATATFRYDYKVLKMLAAGPETRQATDPPGAWLDWQFGHAVWFDASEEGKTLCVDYRLRTYLNPSEDRKSVV